MMLRVARMRIALLIAAPGTPIGIVGADGAGIWMMSPDLVALSLRPTGHTYVVPGESERITARTTITIKHRRLRHRLTIIRSSLLHHLTQLNRIMARFYLWLLRLEQVGTLRLHHARMSVH